MFRQSLAIALAAIAFSLWGYLWYATVFDDIWELLIGRTTQQLDDLAARRGSIQNFFVIFISVVQASGLWLMLKKTQSRSFTDYMVISVILSTLIALPVMGNTTLFVGTPVALLILDYGHFVLGYAGMALTLFLIARAQITPPQL